MRTLQSFSRKRKSSKILSFVASVAASLAVVSSVSIAGAQVNQVNKSVNQVEYNNVGNVAKSVTTNVTAPATKNQVIS
ncbi:hypothetical protein NIES2101_17160, partial [Calothrix sp. HK-06]